MTRLFLHDSDAQAECAIRSRKGFDSFFKGHYTLFVSFACRYGLRTEEAQDIVQDVFAAFWEQRENFSSLIAAKAFCYRSVANRCLNHLKHEDIKNRYAESQMQKMQTEEFIQEGIIREEVSLVVRNKIKALSQREQEIIILSLKDKSNQEIADLLSISVPTVKTHKMHAYAQLRAELAELRFLLLIL